MKKFSIYDYCPEFDDPRIVQGYEDSVKTSVNRNPEKLSGLLEIWEDVKNMRVTDYDAFLNGLENESDKEIALNVFHIFGNYRLRSNIRLNGDFRGKTAFKDFADFKRQILKLTALRIENLENLVELETWIENWSECLTKFHIFVQNGQALVQVKVGDTIIGTVKANSVKTGFWENAWARIKRFFGY